MTHEPRAFARALAETRRAWPALSTYARFEQVVSLLLTILVSIVIAAAALSLCVRILRMLLSGLLDRAATGMFQSIFSMIFTVLIALEFNHSIISVLERKQSIVQVRAVLLIALLALLRKFIIIDPSTTDPILVIGLAISVLALGGVYWLVRDEDRRAPPHVERTRAPDQDGQ